MRGRLLLAGWVVAALNALAGEPVNLVRNSGFEEGARYPANWTRPDDLASFWVADDIRGGKCLKTYTRIHINDYDKRVEQMKLENPPPPDPPRVVKGPGYDTVGGLDGVTIWSDYIDCKPGMRYTLNADVRSEGGKPKIFVKGYSELPTEIDDNGKAKTVLIRRVTFKTYIDCDGGKDWKTSTITFCPTHERSDVKWMRIMIFAYWPPQNYWFDNIKLFEAGLDDEAPKRWAALKAKAEARAKKEAEIPVKEARAMLSYLKQGIERYKGELGSYPVSLDALVKDPGVPAWAGPYVMALGEDPWDRPFAYSRSDQGYELKSLGPDGKEGGGDDVE